MDIKDSKNRETPPCIWVLCILQTRLIWCHNVGQWKSTFSNLIMLYTKRSEILQWSLFTIASKSTFFVLLVKFRTLTTSSSQFSQKKETLSNLNVLYINRTEVLCRSIFTNDHSLKINISYIIRQILDFNDVII